MFIEEEEDFKGCYTEISYREAVMYESAIMDALKEYKLENNEDFFYYFEEYDGECYANGITITFRIKEDKIEEFYEKKLYNMMRSQMSWESDEDYKEAIKSEIEDGQVSVSVSYDDTHIPDCSADDIFDLDYEKIEKSISSIIDRELGIEKTDSIEDAIADLKRLGKKYT